MSENPLSTKATVDTTDFKTGIRNMNREIRALKSEFAASAAALGDWGKSATGLEGKIESLTKEIDVHKRKVESQSAEYERLKKALGENSKETLEAKIKLNNYTKELNKAEFDLKKYTNALEDMGDESDRAGDDTEKLRKKERRATQETITLKSAMKKLGTSLRGVVGGLGTVTRGLGRMTAAAATAVGSVVRLASQAGRAVALMGVAVGVAVGGMLYSTIDPAKDLNETISKSQVVFGDFATSMIMNAKKADEALGMNQQQYLDYTSAIGAALTAGGMGIADTVALSKDAVEHFADLASFHNSEVDDVATSWQSAMRGSYEPIQKYMPFINDTYLKTYGTANGLIDENTATLTANQRAIILNAIAFDKELNPALGDFSRTSGELANLERINQKQWENTKATIGQGLLPLMTELRQTMSNIFGSDAFKKNIEGITESLSGMGKTVIRLFNTGFESGGLSGGLQSLFTGLVDMSPLLSSLKGPFAQVSGYFNDFMGIISGGGSIEQKGAGIGGLIANIITDVTSNKAALAQGALGIIQGLVEGLIGALPELIPVALNLLQSLVNFILTALPMLIPLAVQIIQSLADFLVQNFPMLVTAGIGALLALINGILPELPKLVEVALQMIVTLANGLSEALPTLIPFVAEITAQIVMVLMENLPMLIDAALQLILALAEGLTAALPIMLPYSKDIIMALYSALIEAAPNILDAGVQLIKALANGVLSMYDFIAEIAMNVHEWLVDGVSAAIDEMARVGGMIVDGLWEGIQAKAGEFFEKIRGFFRGIVGAANEELQINSPAKAMYPTGEGIAEGVEVSFAKRFGLVERKLALSLGGMAKKLASSGQAAAGGMTLAGAGGLAAGGGGTNITVHVHVDEIKNDIDIDLMARRVAGVIERRR